MNTARQTRFWQKPDVDIEMQFGFKKYAFIFYLSISLNDSGSASCTITSPVSGISPQNIDQNTGDAEINMYLWALMIHGLSKSPKSKYSFYKIQDMLNMI